MFLATFDGRAKPLDAELVYLVKRTVFVAVQNEAIWGTQPPLDPSLMDIAKSKDCYPYTKNLRHR